MLIEKFNSGEIRPGQTLIEPTSGNTGIGISLAGAILGLKVIVVMAKKNRGDKSKIMRALGAEVVETPNNVSHDSPDSNVNVAKRLQKEIPGSVMLDQYKNSKNPMVHSEQTAEEILKQCDGRVDMLVAGVGTGGTISGIARRFKKDCPECEVY